MEQTETNQEYEPTEAELAEIEAELDAEELGDEFYDELVPSKSLAEIYADADTKVAKALIESEEVQRQAFEDAGLI